MKKISKFFALATVMLAFTAGAFAQFTQTANASATIVTGLTVSKQTDMNFGNIYDDAIGGTVELTPAGGASVATGAITITGAASAASFTATGTPNVNVVVTLPTTAITITNGTDNMTVDTWTSSLGSTAPITGTLANVTGTLPFTVGATLHVGPSLSTGLYTLTNGISVTVNYE